MAGFPERVRQVIAARAMMPDAAPALVAVSGGVDSMVLLHTLAQLAPAHRWRLAVAHFNHQLRGRDSDADERFVQRAAKNLGLPFVSERGGVRALASAQKISVEMAARELRHQFLARAAEQAGARHIFLAHHADDQVELFFLRLLRGAGSQGLGGMKWSAPSPADRRIKLLRPLLEEPKTALLAHARAEKISFREDASNRSPDILRNRLRHNLLPRLRRDIAPNLERAVLRSMELVQDEAEFVTLEALAWLAKKRRTAFDALHPAVQRRVVKLGLINAGIVPQFEHVEFLRARSDEWLTVRAGLRCRLRADGGLETRAFQAVEFQSGEIGVTLGSRAGQAACGTAVWSWKFFPGPKRPVSRPDTECFDADAVGERIILRHWRAGDRFQPIGMKQPVKLQDFFTNAKVPRARRHELWLATTEAGEIFWIEDARIGERFKVTPATRRILQFTCITR